MEEQNNQPPYIVQWPIDQQLRKEALDTAFNVAASWNTKDKWTHKEVVEAATAFYEFLKGPSE